MGLERLIRGRFTLFSMVRFLLRFTFILFLPLLSYMRDKAKDDEILFVLLWMLLIELFCKKVEAMVPSSSSGSFSRSASRFRLMGSGGPRIRPRLGPNYGGQNPKTTP